MTGAAGASFHFSEIMFPNFTSSTYISAIGIGLWSFPQLLPEHLNTVFQEHRTEQFCRLKAVVIWTIGTGAWGGNRTSCGEFLWLKWVKSVHHFIFLKIQNAGCSSQTKHPEICASYLLGDLFIYHHICRAI